MNDLKIFLVAVTQLLLIACKAPKQEKLKEMIDAFTRIRGEISPEAEKLELK